MAALPQILAMLLPLAVCIPLLSRVRSPAVRRIAGVGVVAAWLYAAFEAVVLGLFAISPPGIGADNWPELLVALGVVVGVPVWLAISGGRRTI